MTFSFYKAASDEGKTAISKSFVHGRKEKLENERRKDEEKSKRALTKELEKRNEGIFKSCWSELFVEIIPYHFYHALKFH